MKIDRDLVLYLEKLSRLELSENERAAAETELGKILDFMSNLENLDTENAKEYSNNVNYKKALRKDAAEKSFDREEILKNAPNHDAEYFKAPQIF